MINFDTALLCFLSVLIPVQANSNKSKKCYRCSRPLIGRPCLSCGRPNHSHSVQCWKCGSSIANPLKASRDTPAISGVVGRKEPLTCAHPRIPTIVHGHSQICSHLATHQHTLKSVFFLSLAGYKKSRQLVHSQSKQGLLNIPHPFPPPPIQPFTFLLSFSHTSTFSQKKRCFPVHFARGLGKEQSPNILHPLPYFPMLRKVPLWPLW